MPVLSLAHPAHAAPTMALKGLPEEPPDVELPFPGGEVVHGMFTDWQIDPAVLGSGSFASVRKAVDIRTGAKAVVKSSTFTSSSHANHRLYVLRELATLVHLAAVPHPNIVRVYDAATVGDTFHIFQQQVDGVELFDYLRQRDGHLPVQDVRYITAQLLSALYHMHRHHVLHRDIKLDNILVDPATLHVTLIDFNLSTFFTEECQLAEPVGCINYSSPQILEAAYGRPYSPMYGWSDLWALGVTVYGMLCGFFPFRSEQAKKLYAEHAQLRQRPVQFVGQSVHASAKHFVRTILNLDSFGRITAASLLTHPFITGAGFETPSPAHDARIAHAMQAAVDLAAMPHPYDNFVTGDVVSMDLAVQERAVRHLLYRAVPQCAPGRPRARSAGPHRTPSDETVVSVATSASQESTGSEPTISGDGERGDCDCFGFGPDELAEDLEDFDGRPWTPPPPSTPAPDAPWEGLVLDDGERTAVPA